MSDTVLKPGVAFGNFEILSELGRGGMGRVYKARDVTLDRLVALKVLSDVLSRDDGFVQRFTREARAAARLNHPNIVQIFTFGKEGATWYLAMELVDGSSVGNYLHAGHRFSEGDGILIARHAARALSIAHQAGIIHRDVKPENLMMSGRGDVKLVDLGLAKSLEGDDASLTATGFSMGTPHYISPEQVRGQKDLDGRADVYSLGATLYHVVTGKTPFTGTSGPLVMSRHLTEPVPDPRLHRAELSEGIVRVIARMMAKDRDDRYPDMAAVDADLERVGQGLAPLLAGAPSSSPPPPSISLAMAPTLMGPSLAMGAGTPPRPTSGPRPLARTATAAGVSSVPAVGTATVSPGRGTMTPTGTGMTDSGPADPMLQAYEKELTKHIGPIAKALVRRKAKVATSLEDLVARLAEEIADPAGRQAFLTAVKKAG